MKQRQTQCINLSQAKAFADINKLARSRAKQFSFILPQQDGSAIIFDMIHTVDREKLARKLSKEMTEQGRNIPCLIQVNIGEEEQKSGIAPRELPDFLGFCRDECNLDIQGLMCIPPHDEPPAMFFSLLHKMAKQHNLPHLSMGMSADFEKAIPLDATYIRVGTAIFGEREY